MAREPEPAAPRRPSPSQLIVVGIVALAAIALLLLLLNRPPELLSGASDRPTPSASSSAAGATAGLPTASGPSPSALLVIATPTPATTSSLPPAPTRAPTPRPTATTTTNPTIVSFTAPSTVQCTVGDVRQISLSWRVERASGVELAIDGPGKYDDYPPIATVEVPFACSESQHTYRITSIGGTGPAATMERVVRRSS